MTTAVSQAEAALEAAGDVVFAAAFPDLERARGVHAALAGVEAQHHLAEADLVPAAGRFVLDGEGHGDDRFNAGPRGCQRARAQV